jgi:hypothetical protein
MRRLSGAPNEFLEDGKPYGGIVWRPLAISEEKPVPLAGRPGRILL